MIQVCRTRALPLVALMLVGACAPVTQLSIAERCTPESLCVESAPARAPVLLRDVTPQFVPNTTEEGPAWHVLPHDRVLFVTSDQALLVDASGHVTRVFAAAGGRDIGALVATDPLGDVAVLRHAVIDLRSHTLRSLPEGDEYRACSSSLDRCVSVRDVADGDGMTLRIEHMQSNHAPHAMTVHRSDLLPSDHPDPSVENLPLMRMVHDLRLGEGVIGLSGADGDRFFACTLDAETGRVLGCRRNLPSEPEFVWMGATGEQATLAVGATLEIVRTHSATLGSVARVEGTLVPDSERGGFAYIRSGDTLARIRLETLSRAGPQLPPDPSRVALGDGSASLRGDSVLFFGDDGMELGRATLHAPVPSASWVLDAGLLTTWDGDAGLLRVRPGDEDVRYTGPLREQATGLNIVANRLQFVFADDEALEIGASGIRAVFADEGDSSEHDDARTRVESTFASHPLLIARVAVNPTPSDAAYAYVEAGRAHVTNVDGSDLVAPIDLPASYGSDCRLSFLTNADVILMCQTTRAYARIRFREGRLDPIDYSGSSHSRSGDYVALVERDVTTILNRMTGQTIATLQMPLGHGAVGRVYVSARGDRLKIEEMTGFTVVDLSAPERPVYRWRYQDGREASYDVDDDAVISCTPEHSLSILRPFSGEPPMLLPFAGCSNGSLVRWRRLSGFVAELNGGELRVVRLRDGHVLEMKVVSTGTAFAMMVVRAGEVLAAYPEDSPLLRARVRDRDGAEHLVPLPRFERSVSEYVMEHFAP